MLKMSLNCDLICCIIYEFPMSGFFVNKQLHDKAMKSQLFKDLLTAHQNCTLIFGKNVLTSFQKSCRQDNLDICRYFHDQRHEISEKEYREAFRFSCFHGRLTIAKWLFGLNISLINVSLCETLKDMQYRNGYKKSIGRCEVAEWILEILPTEIKKKNSGLVKTHNYLKTINN
jgi:hypothetical protein